MNAGTDGQSGRAEFERELKSCIEGLLWQAVETIRESRPGFTDDMWAAYAQGARNTLLGICENMGLGSDCAQSCQIFGALGERLRRTCSPAQKGHHRAVNNLLAEIRDARIAVLDKYEALDHKQEMRWETKLRCIERNSSFDEGDADARMMFYRECETAGNELRAIKGLYRHLLSDRAWFARHYETSRPKKQEAA